MDIKPRYNQYRMGAMFISPVQATQSDLDDYVMTTRVGGTERRVWQLGTDCRALAGKLINHEELSKLIIRNEDDFLLVLDLEHPKHSDRILVGGNESRTIFVYKKRKLEKMFKRVEKWLKNYLAGVEPVESIFKYGRSNGYGLLPNADGQLAYVIIRASSYGDSETKYGQPYTEATWGLAD